MADIFCFENSMKAYKSQSPVNTQPQCLDEFIKNAEKIQRKRSFEDKLSDIHNYIVGEVKIPEFVNQKFLPHFDKEVGKIIKNNSMIGTIEIDKLLIDAEIDFLASISIESSPHDLIDESLEFIKERYAYYSEMEWHMLENSNLQHYKIHISLNEIILLSNVNKFRKFDHNMEYLSGN